MELMEELELTIIQEIQTHSATALLYFLGFGTFILTLLVDFFHDDRHFKKFDYYFQEFAYTSLSILLGLFVCQYYEIDIDLCKAISILLGLCGSTIIRKFISKEDTMVDFFLDKISSRIKNKLNTNNITNG